MKRMLSTVFCFKMFEEVSSDLVTLCRKTETFLPVGGDVSIFFYHSVLT